MISPQKPREQEEVVQRNSRSERKQNKWNSSSVETSLRNERETKDPQMKENQARCRLQTCPERWAKGIPLNRKETIKEGILGYQEEKKSTVSTNVGTHTKLFFS